MNVGDTIEILIGPYKGQMAEIINVSFESGARNGWFTVRLKANQAMTLLYAGEEIRGA